VSGLFSVIYVCVYIYIYVYIYMYIYIYTYIKVGLGISRTHVDSQWKAVNKAFHNLLLWTRNNSSIVM